MFVIKLPKKSGSSNKNPTEAKSGSPTLTEATEQHVDQTAPTPILDKLVIIWKIESGKLATDVHGEIYKALTGDTDAFASVYGKLKGFQLAKKVMLPGCEHHPRIDYHYHDKLAQRVRLEFNPSKLGHDGLQELHGVLSTMSPKGWGHFIAYGRITRLDIAVDLVGIRLTKLKMMPPIGQQSQAWWGSSGKLETYQWGKAKGSHTQVYNKTLEQKKHGVTLSGSQVTRIERRLKNPSCKSLGALHALQNPFAGITLTTSMPSPPKQGPAYVWPLFCDCVSARGLDQAVKLLPKDKKSAYRQQFLKAAPPWWDADAIWKNWPNTLQALKLTLPSAWK